MNESFPVDEKSWPNAINGAEGNCNSTFQGKITILRKILRIFKVLKI